MNSSTAIKIHRESEKVYDYRSITDTPITINFCVGIYNFCNPGAISHNEVLDLYKKHIDPKYEYKNFSLDEQAQILKAGRSNNTLGKSLFR